MSRKMFFSSAASTDDRLMEASELCDRAVLIWPWLLPYLDDWGRGSGAPRVIKASVFPGLPVTEDEIGDALSAFVKVGLLERYDDHRGRPVVAVDEEAWWRYQTHIHKTKRDDDSASKFPAPPRDSATARGGSRFTTPRYTPPHHTSASEPTYPQLVETAERIVDERIAEGYEVQNREALVRSIAKSEEAKHRWLKEQQPADMSWTGIGGEL